MCLKQIEKRSAIMCEKQLAPSGLCGQMHRRYNQAKQNKTKQNKTKKQKKQTIKHTHIHTHPHTHTHTTKTTNKQTNDRLIKRVRAVILVARLINRSRRLSKVLCQYTENTFHLVFFRA
jgi:hypothetical protein